MKKLSLKDLKFSASELLERNQLKTLLGGTGDEDAPLPTTAGGGSGAGTCTVSITCNSGSISCSSPKGDCEHITDSKITCDGITYECYS